MYPFWSEEETPGNERLPTSEVHPAQRVPQLLITIIQKVCTFPTAGRQLNHVDGGPTKSPHVFLLI